MSNTQKKGEVNIDTVREVFEDAVRIYLDLRQEPEAKNFTDHQYFEASKVHFLLHTLVQDFKHNKTKFLLDLSQKDGEINQHVINVIENVQGLIKQLEALVETRLLVATVKPRIIRLSEKLKFSNEERKAIIFILLQTTGVYGSYDYQDRSLISNLLDYSGLSAKGIFEFLSSQRMHMQENLIEHDEELSNFSGGMFKMDRVSQAALTGAELTKEEFYSLDGTSLGVVLTDEALYSSLLRAPSSQDEIENKRSFEEFDRDEDSERRVNSIISSLLEAEKESCTFQPEIQEEKTDELDETVYSTDLEYLEDAFEVLLNRVKAYLIDLSHDEDSPSFSMSQKKPEIIQRELEAKEKQGKLRWERRTSKTKKRASWLPRLERLADKLGLDEFEKSVILLLIGNVISQKLRKVWSNSLSGFSEIGTIFAINCKSLAAEIDSRKYFYRDANLVVNKIVHISDRKVGGSDLTDCICTIDRRMLDFMVGLDTEVSQLVEGSACYESTISLDDVIVSKDKKDRLLKTIDSFSEFMKMRKLIGYDQVSSYGTGLIILFHGESGTGKTLMANALGKYLKKKMLRVTPEFFGDQNSIKNSFDFLFRESSIQNAVCFIDECESILESREIQGPSPIISSVLAALEAYDGLLILATNRAQDIDEAVKRRISLSLKFEPPDAHLRELIWKKHVLNLPISSDVSWGKIAHDFELNGGLIKNALILALQLAISRSQAAKSDTSSFKSTSGVIITENDLQRACRVQIESYLELSKEDSIAIETFVPIQGLEGCSCTEEVELELKRVIAYDKMLQKSIKSSTQVEKEVSLNNVVMLYGRAGTGKRVLAAATACECGKPVKSIPYLELARLTLTSSSRSNNLKKFLQDAQNINSILCIQDFESLLISGNNDTLSAITAREMILNQLEKYSGTVIIIVNTNGAGTGENTLHDGFKWTEEDPLPLKFANMLKFAIHVTKPPVLLRQKIWKKEAEGYVHLKEDQLKRLASRYDFTESTIKSCILKAAARSATFQPSLDDIVEACEEMRKLTMFGGNFSGALYT